jgi:hypothetical protein|nr:MAG TPA: hypothetical protein [Caudoviricetes sp.]
MQGLGKFIIGYILGNEKARNWCIEKICQASCIIEKELKKTPIAKLVNKESKDEISGNN